MVDVVPLVSMGWHEAGGFPCLESLSLVHLVDRLEGKTLGLIDKHKDEDGANSTARAPEEEDLGLEVGISWSLIDQVWSGVTDGEVEKPVGGGGDGERLGTDLEWVELTGVNPADWSPGGSKEEDVEADEGNENLVGDIGIGGNSDNGDNVLTDEHANCSHQQELTTTDTLNKPHTRDGGDDVDDVGDETDEESVLDSGRLEEGGSVVENEVDTGEFTVSIDPY